MQSMNMGDAASRDDGVPSTPLDAQLPLAMDGASSPDVEPPAPFDAQTPPAPDGAPTADAMMPGDSALSEDDAAQPIDGALAGDAELDMTVVIPDAALDAGERVDPDAAIDMGEPAQPDAGPDMAVGSPDSAPDMARMDDPDAAPDMAMLAPDAAIDVYPAGPYGTGVGDVIEDLEFISHEGGPLYLSDLRRLEGARLINVSTVAGWCGVCVRKMAPFEEVQQRLRPSGFIGVISIYQERGGDPADADDAARWRRSNGLTGVVVADPVPVMDPYFPRFGREKYLLIDARTMEIVHISETFTPDELGRRAEAWLEE